MTAESDEEPSEDEDTSINTESNDPSQEQSQHPSRNALSAAAVKIETKAEVFERILDANTMNPIVDLTMDVLNAEALAVGESNFGLNDSDDSDDEFQILAAANGFTATEIKFDFDTHDIISGDLPFTTVSSIFITSKIYIFDDFTSNQFFLYLYRVRTAERMSISKLFSATQRCRC